jgi:hypothetical protein
MSFNVYQVIYKVSFAHPEDRTDDPLTDGVREKEFTGKVLARDIFHAVKQVKDKTLHFAAEYYNKYLPEGKEVRYNFQYDVLNEELTKADVVATDVFVAQPFNY